MPDVGNDIRYALRQLVRDPALATIVVLMLGLAAGATTAIFSVVDALVLRPVPISHPDQVVRIFETNPSTDAFSTSEPNYLDFRDESHSFSTLAAISGASATLLGHGDPVALNGTAATASYFSLFAVHPIVGRTYGAENDVKGGDTHVVLLSAAVWARVFGSDSSIVGQVVNFDGVGYRVLGVVPDQYGPLSGDYWVPLVPDRGSARGNHLLLAFGRLRPGVTIEMATSDLKAIARRLAETYPTSNGDWGVRLQAFDGWIVGPALRRQAFLLFGAVALVLLLACANVGNLLLARATVRSREMSLRAALGAGRERIIQQLITESLVLATIGVAVGLAIAWATMPLVRAADPGAIPRLDEATINGHALAFALLVAAVTGIGFGLAPALHTIRADLHTALRQGARAVSPAGRRSRGALVVSEMALAVVLLIAAGLFGRSFLRLRHVQVGFEPADVLQLSVNTPTDWSPAQRAVFFNQVEEALAAVPEVQGIGMTSIAPFSGGNTTTQFLAEGHEHDRSSFFAADWRSVSPGVFAALGIPLKRGRLLERSDLADHPLVAVISETMAAKLWPGQDPIGKRVMPAQARQRVAEVVGVVGDIRDQSPASDVRPAIYFPVVQKPWYGMSVMVKARGRPALVIADLKRALRVEMPSTPVPDITLLTVAMRTVLAPQRFTAGLLAAFAAIAVVLASLGIYGIISYGVAQRTAEMGMRMALGAAPEHLLVMVLREGGLLASAGILIGGAVAFVLAQDLGALLAGSSPTDPATYAGVALFAVLLTATASWVPARRAARIEPLTALRGE